MKKETQEMYGEALRRMEACRRKGKQATTLDLVNLGITTRPPEVGQLTALMWLDLSNKQLTTLPPEIGQLAALTQRDLIDNQLTTLPAQLRDLSKLERLFLHGNPALELSPSVLGPDPRKSPSAKW